LSADNDRNFRFRHIYAFIKDPVGSEDGKCSVCEIFQNGQALAFPCVRENRRHQKPPRDLYRHRIRAGKHKNLLTLVQPEYMLQHPKLFDGA
jgi:hypothetical protein